VIEFFFGQMGIVSEWRSAASRSLKLFHRHPHPPPSPRLRVIPPVRPDGEGKAVGAAGQRPGTVKSNPNILPPPAGGPAALPFALARRSPQPVRGVREARWG